MGPVSMFLLTVATIFVIGVIGELIFERTGVPDVVWLIAVGIVLGPLGHFVERSQLMAVAPFFGALTLVVVLFDGGSELRIRDLKEAAPRASLLALLSFVASVGVIAPTSMAAAWAGILPSSWTWLHGITLGTILGGSSSVVVMPALHKAGLAPRLANLLNLESALTDVLCVVATAACIQIAVSGSTSAAGAAVTLAKAFGIGFAIGGVAGLLAVLVLRRLKRSHYAYPLTLGTLLVLYVLIDELGGSAALGILTTAVMVGNAPELSKAVGLAKTASLGHGVANVHDQITFIIKSFFFTFIGAMLGPPLSLLLLGTALGVALLVARMPAVAVATARSPHSTPARGLVGVALPRGMAAGVLAMMPAQAGIPGTQQLPVVVFAAVLTTILIFAAGFPLMRRRLVRLDPGALVVNEVLARTARRAADSSFDADASASVDASGLGVSLPAGAADATTVDPAAGLADESADLAIPLITESED